MMSFKYHSNQHSDSSRIFCEKCNHFIRNERYERHVRESKCSNEKKELHVCSICEKIFSSNKHLEVHGAIHMEARRFPCSICKAAFKQKGNLETHMKRKHYKLFE